MFVLADDSIRMKRKLKLNYMSPKIKEAIAVLNKAGYVTSLWHISDVQNNYVCTISEAELILEEVLSCEHTTQIINEAIDYEAEQKELECQE